MSNKTEDRDKGHIELTLSIPSEIHNDLQKIADFNKVSPEDLAYSYLIDGIAGDARIVKRAEFRNHASETIGKDEFDSKSSRDIINEFNLVY